MNAKEKEYSRILVARPNIKFDEDIGFLKGDEKQKIDPLIRPIYDNLEQLTNTGNGGKSSDTSQAEQLFSNGIITAQAMAYMRGRSISDTWMILDEAQNMTPTQAFGIVSRAGIGTKVILCGDPAQIDSDRVDSRTNGLSYAAERMKGDPLTWQITLNNEECVRSELALSAIKNMSPKGYQKLV